MRSIFFIFIIGLVACACSSTLPKPFYNPVESRLIPQAPYFSEIRGGCGPAALATVLTYNGRPTTPPEVLLVFGENRPSPRAMAGFVQRIGEQEALVYSGEPEQLLAAVRQNKLLIVRLGLAIAPLGAQDYAVLVGYTPEGPVLNAGIMHQQIVPWIEFLASWHQADNLIIQIKIPLGS